MCDGAPLYSLKLSSAAADAEYLLHASLDLVDLAMWSSPGTFLKVVDRHAEQLVSAYVTPGGARLLVLHDARADEGVRAFCAEVHEVYTRLLLNPFYAPGARIESAAFDARVRQLARRYFALKE